MGDELIRASTQRSFVQGVRNKVQYSVMIDASQLVIPFVFIFGLIIGSFLNVVIYRIHTGRSLEGRLHYIDLSAL